MCGVAGYYRPGGLTEAGERDLAAMCARLAHRGPDAAGRWIDAAAGIALGHRRLSILELSEAGSQPMQSHSGRYVLVTNGEIYNHLEVRDELARAGNRPAWRGHSDTETMLAAFDRWGPEAALTRFAGMFAFALWDRAERCLLLARDRAGEKPLYYGMQQGTLLFGSELKALRAHPAFRAGVSRGQLAKYLARGYVPAPHSIHEGIFKLPPGCVVRFDGARADMPAPVAYWSFRDVAKQGLRQPFTGTDAEAVELLEATLARAVASQSVADVPLGAFLSGGIDSSAVVALMQAQATRPVRTFAIGFEEARFNEAPHARKVAAHLGTDHAELIVTAREAMSVVPRLPALYDEPFGDSSAIPTFLVAQLARRQVTVSLSGDAGDELFGGYTRYGRGLRLWRLLRCVPRALRATMGPGLGAHYARMAVAGSPAEMYDAVMLDAEADRVVVGGRGGVDASVGLDDRLAGKSLLHAMMLADSTTYLPDDILVKVDRASMGVSLESRVPLLDHRVIELAWRMPARLKLRGGRGKWLLRQVLAKHVPPELFERPKQGFGMPVGDWIRGGMRDWAESHLSAARLAGDGFLDPARVRDHWARHLRGETRSGEGLWRVLAFQAWLAESRAA